MILAARVLPGHEVQVLTTIPENIRLMESHGVRCRLLRYPFYRRRIDRLIADEPGLRLPLDRFGRRAGFTNLTYIDSVLHAASVDLAIFLGHSAIPLSMLRTSFVATVLDLSHRDCPAFPEIREEFADRERFFSRNLPRAVKVIVNTDALGQRVCQLYGVDPAHLIVLPFLPSAEIGGRAPECEVARIRASYKLEQDYVFYPAQFWPHKNHVYVLEGLRALEEQSGIRLHAAFAGSDAGNQEHVQRRAVALGLQERVHFLGFVPSGHLAALYSGAKALVMPSYFGPTNIPPLEAFATGCPVIYSDTPTFRNDLGAAALYCDLACAGSLADQLLVVLQQPNIRMGLAVAGRELLRRASIKIYADRLGQAVDEFAYLRARWTDE